MTRFRLLLCGVLAMSAVQFCCRSASDTTSSDSTSSGSTSSSDTPQPVKLGDFFFASYWEDRNQDGEIQPEEWVGAGDTFHISERVTCVGTVQGKAGSKLGFKLYSPDGLVVKEIQDQVGEDLFVRRIAFEPKEIFKLGGAGKYAVEWYLNGNLIRRLALVIVN
jgi:hypothetical protein